jgi:hypothetical protein
MLGKSPLWVATQHGHSPTTMLRTYTAWTGGTPETEIAAIRRAMEMPRKNALATELAVDLSLAIKPQTASLRKITKNNGGEGGIVRGYAAHPSLTLGTAVAWLRRPAPAAPRRLVEPSVRTPRRFQANEIIKGTGSPFYNFIWRRGRDSNPRRAFDPYALSRGAPSTTRPPLRIKAQRGFAERGMIPARSSPGKAMRI